VRSSRTREVIAFFSDDVCVAEEVEDGSGEYQLDLTGGDVVSR